MESIKEIFKIGVGPSSSHTMGPQKAASIFKSKYPQADNYKIILYGSLAATGKGHFTDQIIINTLKPINTNILWQPEVFLPLHPNGIDLLAFKNGEEIGSWRVYSVGGGSIKDESNFHTQENQIYELSSMSETLKFCQESGRNFWELVAIYEEPDIWDYLENIWTTMKACIDRGLNTEGVLPGTLKLPRKALNYSIKANNIGFVLGEIGSLFAYALAVSEENASGGVIVTAPTCGSAGVLPAVLLFLKQAYQINDRRILNALATAGLIGNLVKTNASISGAEVGCQGEIGTACAMASAATAQLLGGSPSQIEYAAEMGLEHHLGLTCDPIQGYVQIPCIERNAVAAARALECASYALFSDGQHRISFDRVVETMNQTGRDLQSSYRETSIGGLAKEWKGRI